MQPGNKFDNRGRIPLDGKTEDSLMYTVVRPYFGKGAKELFDVLEKNTTDVEKTLRSVTVCNDKTGTDENLEKTRDWIARNAVGSGVPLRRYRRDQSSLT